LQETLVLVYCKLGTWRTLKFMGGVRLVKMQNPDLGFGNPENKWGEDITGWGWALFCCPDKGSNVS